MRTPALTGICECRIRDEIVRSGFGTVHSARDPGLGHAIALKMLHRLLNTPSGGLSPASPAEHVSSRCSTIPCRQRLRIRSCRLGARHRRAPGGRRQQCPVCSTARPLPLPEVARLTAEVPSAVLTIRLRQPFPFRPPAGLDRSAASLPRNPEASTRNPEPGRRRGRHASPKLPIDVPAVGVIPAAVRAAHVRRSILPQPTPQRLSLPARFVPVVAPLPDLSRHVQQARVCPFG